MYNSVYIFPRLGQNSASYKNQNIPFLMTLKQSSTYKKGNWEWMTLNHSLLKLMNRIPFCKGGIRPQPKVGNGSYCWSHPWPLVCLSSSGHISVCRSPPHWAPRWDHPDPRPLFHLPEVQLRVPAVFLLERALWWTPFHPPIGRHKVSHQAFFGQRHEYGLGKSS